MARKSRVRRCIGDSRGSAPHMKIGQKIWLCALSTLLLGACASQTSDIEQNASLMARSNVVPKESVAAERCPEWYLLRESQQGAFHRTIVC